MDLIPVDPPEAVTTVEEHGMLPWELEDWLTEAGDDVVNQNATFGPASLGPLDRLLYHVWLLDTEVRNGGVSQYIFNRGEEAWPELVAMRLPQGMPALAAFIEQARPVVSIALESRQAILGSGRDLDELYYSLQEPIVRELQAIYEASVL